MSKQLEYIVVHTGPTVITFQRERYESLEAALAAVKARHGEDLYMEGNLQRVPSGGVQCTGLAHFWRSAEDRKFDRSQGNRDSSVAFISARI